MVADMIHLLLHADAIGNGGEDFQKSRRGMRDEVSIKLSSHSNHGDFWTAGGGGVKMEKEGLSVSKSDLFV